MEPLAELTGEIFMQPLDAPEAPEDWVLIGTYSFALTAAVLPADWDLYPGSYRNAARTLTLSWASRVRIVPTGGYQIAQNWGAIVYAAVCDFKTQGEISSGYYNTLTPPTARYYVTAADAASAWMGRGTIELNLGSDKKLAWGGQDDPLGDNTNDAISFQVYAIK